MSVQTNPSQPPRFDPGLTQQYTGNLQRAINRDGKFNVRRLHGSLRDWHPYLALVNMSWPRFILLIALVFFVTNSIFASLYWLAGIEHIKNSEAPTKWETFANAVFFSAHTLTTVGYGNMWPVGFWANLIAATESLAGVLGFAIATGLMFGRFSRPSARFGFSEKALIAPYMDGLSLQFRVVNRRSNNIINVEARVLIMTLEYSDGVPSRRFAQLELERPDVLFFALTWTVVHPITERSPLYGKTPADLKAQQTEIMILMKGFDDTFGQTVNQRFSYRYDEIEWGARFAPAFNVDPAGEILIDLNRIGATVPAALPVEAKS